MPYLVNGRAVSEELIREERQRIGRDPRWAGIPDTAERARRLQSAAESSAVDKALIAHTAANDLRPLSGMKACKKALRRTQAFLPGWSAAMARLGLGALLTSATAPAAFAQFNGPPDPGCTSQQAWPVQVSPRTDSTGASNINYPLVVATYWGTALTENIGSAVMIEGQFPAARFMSLELYDYDGNVLGGLADESIDPDPGQNNPFRPGGGTAQGNYTVRLVFGPQPATPPPNTLYSGLPDTTTARETQTIVLLYRVYYPNDQISDPDDLTGEAAAPVLPSLIVGGIALSTCPPRPVITPQTATVWGRLDQIDFVGVAPPTPVPAGNPPKWFLTHTSSTTSYYPNIYNSYMTAILSRQYLSAPFNYNLVVMQMRAPTFADTQAGVPSYANADVRFWGLCTDEPLTTGVVRCIPDDQAPLSNGYVTFVISDPSYQPSTSVLSQWGASWLAWGALEPDDYVYNAEEDVLTNANGVFYYCNMMYRQTLANPAFLSSITNVSTLPITEQQAAMGAYWPKIGYCTLQAFETSGPDCIGQSGQP